MSPCAILITLRIIVACLSSKGSCPSRGNFVDVLCSLCYSAARNRLDESSSLVDPVSND